MFAATMTLIDNTALEMFVRDPDTFVRCVEAAKSNMIGKVVIGQASDRTDLQECNIVLSDSTQIYCILPITEVGVVTSMSDLIVSCEEVFLEDMVRLATIEKLLDNRMTDVAAVINGIPNKRRRLALHAQYLQRKAAYISTLEALIDGKFRD